MAMTRSASATWQGDLPTGEGTVSTASDFLQAVPTSWRARTEDATGQTSPEELLAAAHGGCFTMSLAGELTGAGTPPGRLDVHCRITMDEVEGQGHLIVHSALEVRAQVEGVGEDAFAEAVDAAHRGCSFSSLLRAAGVGIDIETVLEGGD